MRGPHRALEPLLEIRVGGDVLGEHLDGHGAVQAGVAGLIDLTHPARAEGGLDLVGTEGGAWGDWERITPSSQAYRPYPEYRIPQVAFQVLPAS